MDGAGSKWTVGYELDIGDSYGTGALRITNGGTVSSGSSYVGGEPYSNVVGTGTVTVEGPGSTWNSGSLAVGYAGIGTLNIISGGTVTASSVSIGSLSSLVSMTVGDRSALNVGTGKLEQWRDHPIRGCARIGERECLYTHRGEPFVVLGDGPGCWGDLEWGDACVYGVGGDFGGCREWGGD